MPFSKSLVPEIFIVFDIQSGIKYGGTLVLSAVDAHVNSPQFPFIYEAKINIKTLKSYF